MMYDMAQPRPAAALRTHRFILRFALAASQLFVWVFIFQYFYLVSSSSAAALARTILLYALSQAITCLATPLAARFLRHGVRRTMLYGALSAAAAFVALGAAFGGYLGAQFELGLLCFAMLLGLYRALYWIPYELEAAYAGGKRGASISGELLVALAPLLGGVCIATSAVAPIWLLFLAAVFCIVSVVALVGVPEAREDFSWGYREAFMHLMARENREFVSRAIREGMSGAALLLLWPIAAFLIVGWSYPVLGIVFSLTFVLAILARPLAQRLLRARTARSRFMEGFLAASPWALRLVVASPFSITLVDSYSYSASPRRQGMDVSAFEQAADGGSYLDEHTALKEMGLTIGRLATCALAAALALLVSLPAAFIGAFALAALASASLAVEAA